jgi:voltage-gated sodium channel
MPVADLLLERKLASRIGSSAEGSRCLPGDEVDMASEQSCLAAGTSSGSHDEFSDIQEEIREEMARVTAETMHAKAGPFEINDTDVTASHMPTRSSIGPRQRGFRRYCQRLVHNTWFDAAMGVIIVINSCLIGVEVQLKIDRRNTDFVFQLESFFLSCFIVELLLRLLADGKHNFNSGWFLFDLLLIVTGVLSSWIIVLVKSMNIDVDEVPLVSQVLALRVLRLMRLVRALRLVEAFSELWKLCHGLIKSGRTMISVLLLILIAIYVFACLGVDLITESDYLKGDARTHEIVQTHFSSLPRVMMTLMQFANADSLAGIYYPLVEVQPLLAIYFLVLWLVVTVALMNLVTAIIVENAMAKSREDAEEALQVKRKVFRRVEPSLRSAFRKMDQDRSGTLTVNEVAECLQHRHFKLPSDVEDFIETDKLIDFFNFLDDDDSGEIDEDEFVSGVAHLAFSNVSIETTQILQLVRSAAEVSKNTNQLVNKLSESAFGRRVSDDEVHSGEKKASPKQTVTK